MNSLLIIVLVIRFENAALLDQGVLESIIEKPISVALLKYMIDRLGGHFGRLNVLWAYGLKLHDLVVAGKDPHQAWLNRTHRVADHRTHDR